VSVYLEREIDWWQNIPMDTYPSAAKRETPAVNTSLWKE